MPESLLRREDFQGETPLLTFSTPVSIGVYPYLPDGISFPLGTVVAVADNGFLIYHCRTATGWVEFGKKEDSHAQCEGPPDRRRADEKVPLARITRDLGASQGPLHVSEGVDQRNRESQHV